MWATVALAVSCGSANGRSRQGERHAVPTAAPGPAQDADAALGESLDRYISAFGKGWGESAAFSGYVAVARDGRIVFGRAYGSAERETGTPAGPDTLFRIASVSKTFTAVGILQLAEKGRLSIDDPVRKYLPELPPYADAITIRHCLTHSAGLPALPEDAALAHETGKPHPLTTLFASYQDKALKYAPGERFDYSNEGFTLLGAILERISGQSYEAYFQEHVFRPAGMLHTTTVSEPPPPQLAVGYAVGDADAISRAAPIAPLVTFGCGAILSSANDLVAWDQALRGTRLLGEASKRRMFTAERDPGALALGNRGQMALSWWVAEKDGHASHWHGGGLPGFLTSFTSVPDAKLTVVVLSNLFSDHGLDQKIGAAAEQIALTGTGPPPEEEPAPHALTASQVAALAGEYRIDAATQATLAAKFAPWIVERWTGLTLTAKDGHLFLRWSGQDGPELVQSVDGALFTKQLGLRLAAERDGAGRARAVALLKKGGVDTRYVRFGSVVDPPPPGHCPPGMARLPGGSPDGEPSASLAAFCLDTTEVTVGAYAKCVATGRCKPAPTTASFEGLTPELAARWNPTCNGARKERLDHPINCVDWLQATAYCAAQAKRLPTQAEWEWAARGGDQARKYPWGFRDPDAQRWCAPRALTEGTCPVGAFPEGDAWGGIHDLAGNVGEWTSTPDAAGRVIESSGWNMPDGPSARVGKREGAPVTFRGPTTGFRCAR